MVAPLQDPAVAKRFRSGRPCLDLAHTAATPYWVEPELVPDAAALEHWLGHVLALDDVHARPRDVPAAHRLRAAVLELARARATGRPLGPVDVETVNAFAAVAPPVPRLAPDGTPQPGPVAAAAALSAIARDAVDLLSGPLGHRIRICGADDCAYLFVDASRPGTRRWCSMERCGNLAKVRAHREKAAAAR